MTAMPRLEIDPHSPVSSYVQLANALRAMIESGEIGPREPLPSISYIQQETGLSPNTIRHAVSVLIDEGLAYTVGGRGTFVSPKN